LPFAVANGNSAQDDNTSSNPGRINVDFQINGETYFVDLAENERRWEVMVSTPTGARSIPVYEDAPDFERLTIVVEDEKKRRIPN
jgi:hypothetical protein